MPDPDWKALYNSERAISLALAEALKEKQCNCHTWGAFQCKRCIALSQYAAQNADSGDVSADAMPSKGAGRP